jgi:hypothetical protein
MDSVSHAAQTTPRPVRPAFSGSRKLLFRLLALALPPLTVLALLEMALRFTYHPPISPGSVITHPLRRYTLRPGHTGTTLDATFHVNSLGLRGEERRIDRDAAAFRVAVFGDSIAFGEGVETSRTFPALLEAGLAERLTGRRVQVFNFSVPSYNTAMEYRYLQEAFDRFAPHLVVVQYTAENDAIDGGEPSSINRLLPVRLLKDAARASYSYEWLSRKWQTIKHGRKVPDGDQGLALLRSADSIYTDQYPGWVRTQAAFGDFARFCDERGVALLFAVFVNNMKIGATRDEDPLYETTEKVLEALRKQAVEHVVLLDDAFRDFAGREPDLWVTAENRHFSPLAHELSARALLEYIMRHRVALIPSPAQDETPAAAQH